jgi:hypothetical protein
MPDLGLYLDRILSCWRLLLPPDTTRALLANTTRTFIRNSTDAVSCVGNFAYPDRRGKRWMSA